jgi:hypothetical protein
MTKSSGNPAIDKLSGITNINSSNDRAQAIMDKRKDYSVNSELQDLYNRDLAAVNAPSSIQQSEEAVADAGASNLASTIKSNSTSATQAIAGATLAEQQRQAGYRQAKNDGAHQQMQNRTQLGASASALNQAKDQAYELNVQQPYEIALQHEYGIDSQNRQAQITSNNQQNAQYAQIAEAIMIAAL